MVCSGVAEEATQRVYHHHQLMAMGPERSKPLHNFKLPCLKWGNQRYLRCMKVNSAGDAIATVADHRSPAPRIDTSPITRRRELEEKRRLVKDSERRVRISKPKFHNDDDGEDEDGIEAVREKLIYDLKTAADKMKDAILREEADVAVVPEEVRPWNLRTRRAALKAPLNDGGGGKGLMIEDKRLNYSPLRSEGNGVKSPRLRGGAEKKEKTKFAVSLSRKEIEEDYLEIVGERPPRRPKKRPKIVQKQIDSLFPGLWLTEITADSYKVPEFPDSGKR